MNEHTPAGPVRAQHSNRIRKWMLIPFGTSVGVLLFLVGLEVWQAVYPPPRWITESDVGPLHAMLDADTSPTGLCLFDDACGYRFKPEFSGQRHEAPEYPHVTNSLGLLGSREPSPQGQNVVVLGDSVTYGDGVRFESTFAAELQRAAGDSVYVGVAACPGWSTDQQLTFFDGYLKKSQPWDVAILVVCLNDLVRFRWAALGPNKYDMVMEDANTSLAAWRLLRINWSLRGDGLAPLLRLDDATRLAWNKAKWEAYQKEVLTPFIKRSDRPKLIVALVPALPQLEAIADGAPRDKVLFPQAKLEEYCAEHGITYVDLLPAFGDGSPQDFYRDDLHLNEPGHRAIGERIWPALSATLGDAVIRLANEKR